MDIVSHNKTDSMSAVLEVESAPTSLSFLLIMKLVYLTEIFIASDSENLCTAVHSPAVNHPTHLYCKNSTPS